MRNRALRSLLLSVAALTTLTSASCPGPASRIVVLLRSIGAMPFDYGSGGNVSVGRAYTIFAGTAASDVGVTLSTTGISATNPIRLRSADGSLVATLTTPDSLGTTVTRVPGNVAIVEADWNGMGIAPTATVRSIDITTNKSIAAPPALDGLQMSLNSPVELFFSSAAPVTYYLWIEGVGTTGVDVVLDGPGRLHVSDPVGGRVILDPTGAPLPGSQVLATVDATTGGFARFNAVTPPRGTLILTVSNVATMDTGHARLSINATADIVPLTVWFNTAFPPGLPPVVAPFGGSSAAALTASMTAIANETSKTLYQATGGRVRLGAVTTLVGPTPPAGVVDVRVDPFDGPLRSHVFGYQGMPAVSIELDHDWFFLPTATAGSILAHEIFHYRYFFPDEYREAAPGELTINGLLGITACTNCECPGSIMSGPGDELCWPGSHNPFGSTPLSIRSTTPLTGPNTSMWAIIAPRLGTSVPTMTPPRVLRFSVLGGGSTVMLP